MEKRKYFPGLNILRFPISIGIAVFHYGIIFGVAVGGSHTIIRYIYQYAGYGVEVFFTVSGFLMYWNSSEEIRRNSKSISGGG